MVGDILRKIERFIFGYRNIVLGAIGIFTVAMAFFAAQLHMEAGFDKQVPTGHEYIETYNQYKNDLFGANRLIVVVRARHGTIWTAAGLQRLYDVTQAVAYLPNVDRLGVKSLWTPNSYVSEITEDGFRAEPIIPGTVTPASLTTEAINEIRRSATQGNYIGSLVSRDHAGAMVIAEISEVGADGKRIDYLEYNKVLEKTLRAKYEDANFEIQIIGFAKQIGDIADGARNVLVFCLIALVLTALAVYWYCHSVKFTLLPIVCSLTSLVWQFGLLKILGFGLDPLGVLVPFLVFAIGVSHGVQQVNFITREIADGKSSFDAARHSFSGLLIPGILALVTACVSFVTLMLIPIPMITELAITASLGVTFKIITNLVMLPVVASYFNFPQDYASKVMANRAKRASWLNVLSRVAQPRNAGLVMIIVVVVLIASAWQSRDRVVGALQPGAPELRADARFNRDATSVANSFDVGLDWLSVVIEAPAQSCENPAVAVYGDNLEHALQNVPGVVSVTSYPSMLRAYNEGYNEGFPKMEAVPIAPDNYAALSAEIARVRGYVNKDCSMGAVHLYLTDHKATTINRVIEAVKKYRDSHPVHGIKVRLAGGNAGIMAATNDVVAGSEMPMLMYVYAAIVILVFLVYRDVRAVLACCLPLAVGTVIGYWFMKSFDIGLTVATLPVMVLATGIGVDYAFYIYNRLQLHLSEGRSLAVALQNAILEVGMATIFTAVTLAIGVATWSFSTLKFQADMGKLLAFMFIVNLIMAMTALPALAVLLDRWFPRRKPVRAARIFQH